jgi:putative membrane protein
MKGSAILRGAIVSAALLFAGPLLADAPNSQAQNFASQASAAGMAEIDAAKLALKKSQSADVKTFAQHIIDDHTKAGEELKAIARKQKLELSDSPDMVDQAKAKMLDVRDESFDAAYANNQVGAHEDAVKLFTDAANNSSDTEIKAFAQKTLPVLQQHLEMAQELVKAHPSK